MNLKRTLTVIALIGLNIGCDQISKIIVRKELDSGVEIPVLGDYFVMLKVENTGAFLGLGSDFNPKFLGAMETE